MTLNPDLQASIPLIMQLLDQLHSGQQQLLQLWQLKKNKLDQCLQLRMFEQDCEKVNNFTIQLRIPTITIVNSPTTIFTIHL